MLLVQHQITIFSIYIFFIILLGLIIHRIKFVLDNVLIQHKGFHRIIIVYCFFAGLVFTSPDIVNQSDIFNAIVFTQNSIEYIIGNKQYAQSVVIGILYTIGFTMNYLLFTLIGKIFEWIIRGFKNILLKE